MTIRSNSAANGGGVYISDTFFPFFSNSLVANNTVTVNGGGIYFISTSAQLKYLIIEGNLAASSGGGMHIDTNNVITADALIFRNNKVSAGKGGGGIYISQSNTFTMKKSNFRRNNAQSGSGGSILASSNSILSISMCTFENEKAY